MDSTSLAAFQATLNHVSDFASAGSFAIIEAEVVLSTLAWFLFHFGLRRSWVDRGESNDTVVAFHYAFPSRC
jgi:hypothetical protein